MVAVISEMTKLTELNTRTKSLEKGRVMVSPDSLHGVDQGSIKSASEALGISTFKVRVLIEKGKLVLDRKGAVTKASITSYKDWRNRRFTELAREGEARSEKQARFVSSTSPDENEIYNMVEASELLGLSRQRLYQLIGSGKIAIATDEELVAAGIHPQFVVRRKFVSKNGIMEYLNRKKE